MTVFDAFGYSGKRALVVGAATGMGAALAELLQDAGAEVVMMDIATCSLDGATEVHVDLADKASIDAAVDQWNGPLDALFLCAGVADGTAGIEKINFIGHRYLIDHFLATDALRPGSAIAFISSAAGLGWEADLELLSEYLDVTDFELAARWAVKHGKADYMWSKEAVCAYVARQAFPLLKRGIRINAICPGPTDTPLARANAETWLGFGADYRGELHIQPSTPLEQAYPLAFLCSDAAAALNGVTLISDVGYISSGITGSYPSATPVAQFLTGKLR